MKCNKCKGVFITSGSGDKNLPDDLLIEEFICYDCLMKLKMRGCLIMNDKINVNLFKHVESLTKGDRRRDYNHPLPNHIGIAKRWSDRLGITLDPITVAFMLGVDLKGERQSFTSKWDNVVDVSGYMDCVNEMINLLIEMGYNEFCNPNITLEENRTNAMKFLTGLSYIEQHDLQQLCILHLKRKSL